MLRLERPSTNFPTTVVNMTKLREAGTGHAHVFSVCGRRAYADTQLPARLRTAVQGGRAAARLRDVRSTTSFSKPCAPGSQGKQTPLEGSAVAQTLALRSQPPRFGAQSAPCQGLPWGRCLYLSGRFLIYKLGALPVPASQGLVESRGLTQAKNATWQTVLFGNRSPGAMSEILGTVGNAYFLKMSYLWRVERRRSMAGKRGKRKRSYLWLVDGSAGFWSKRAKLEMQPPGAPATQISVLPAAGSPASPLLCLNMGLTWAAFKKEADVCPSPQRACLSWCGCGRSTGICAHSQ